MVVLSLLIVKVNASFTNSLGSLGSSCMKWQYDDSDNN